MWKKLSAEERQDLEQRQSDVIHDFRSAMHRQRQLMHRLAEEIREVERNYSALLIAPLIDELRHQHHQFHVHRYLDAVQEHILSHLDAFKAGGQRTQDAMPPFMRAPTDQDRLVEYTVNVIVDNSDTQGAPVLVEDTPTYKNLFGAIDRAVDPHGRVVTNFSRIRAGSVLRANGGYVLFNLEDALTEPFVWKTLKRVLQSQQIKVEAYDPFAMFTVRVWNCSPGCRLEIRRHRIRCTITSMRTYNGWPKTLLPLTAASVATTASSQPPQPTTTGKAVVEPEHSVHPVELPVGSAVGSRQSAVGRPGTADCRLRIGQAAEQAVLKCNKTFV